MSSSHQRVGSQGPGPRRARVARRRRSSRRPRGARWAAPRRPPRCAAQIPVEGDAADLDLGVGVTVVEEPDAARRRVAPRRRPGSSSRRPRRPCVVGLRPAFTSHVEQEAVERSPRDLGRRVPDRHVERADRHAPLPVPARLSARHHRAPGPHRVEPVPVRGREVRGGEQARGEPLADEACPARSARTDPNPRADHRPAPPRTTSVTTAAIEVVSPPDGIVASRYREIATDRSRMLTMRMLEPVQAHPTPPAIWCQCGPPRDAV